MRKSILLGALFALSLPLPRSLDGQDGFPPPMGVERPVRVGRVTILDPLPEGVVPADLPVRPGAPYTLPALQLTERRIARAFAEQGHPFALVEFTTDVEGDPPVVNVQFRITPGPRAAFGEAVLEAEAPVEAAEAARWLPFGPGEPFTASAVEHAAERLRSLPVVQQVTVGVERSPLADTLIVPTFALTTGRVQGVLVDGTVSSARCVSGRLSWGHRHLFGAPRMLVLEGGGSNLFARQLRRFPCTGTGEGEFANPDYFVQAELIEPLRPRTWLVLGSEVSRVSEPQAWIRRGWQLRGGLRREVERALFLGATVSPERRDNPAGGPLLCGVYAVCAGEALNVFLDRRSHTPLELDLAWTPPPFEGVLTPGPNAPIWLIPLPRTWRFAVRSRVTGALAGAFSQATYGAGILEASAARLLGQRLELAGRARAGGLLDGGEPTPPQARLYGGGILGVRGVPPNRLGPKVLTVPFDAVAELGCEPVPGGCEGITVRENAVRVRPTGGDAMVEVGLEARAWTFPWLQLSLFTDFGALRSGALPGAPAFVTPSEAIVTPGVGVMVVSPIGPVRVDVAYDPSPVRLYPLLTVTEETGQHILLGTVRFDPFTFDTPGRGREILRRLNVQLSMGPPF